MPAALCSTTPRPRAPAAAARRSRRNAFRLLLKSPGPPARAFSFTFAPTVSPIPGPMRLLLSLLLILTGLAAQAQKFSPAEIARWKQQAGQVSITRDTYGVPHIYGKTDADAVFGLLYSQCEDDFDRVEANYLDAIGRQAEVDGEAALYHDLRARLFMDS